MRQIREKLVSYGKLHVIGIIFLSTRSALRRTTAGSQAGTSTPGVTRMEAGEIAQYQTVMNISKG